MPLEVMIVSIELWDPASGSYGGTPPSILQGQEAGVRVTAHNGHPYPARLRVDVAVAAPDGSHATQWGVEQNVAAGANAIWEARWACPQTGTYAAAVALYEYFEELVGREWDLADVAAVDVATVTSTLQQWMPILGSVMTLVMLGTMAQGLLRRKP